MKENMGQIIKRLRKERNLTQEELAEQLNISAQAISKWENGTSMPDISQQSYFVRRRRISLKKAIHFCEWLF